MHRGEHRAESAAKKMYIYFVCSADCNAQSATTPQAQPAGTKSFVILHLDKKLLKRMNSTPGKFKLANTINATDQTTGATDSISHTFRLKR